MILKLNPVPSCHEVRKKKGHKFITRQLYLII